MNYRDDVKKLKMARHDAEQLKIFHEWSEAHPEFQYEAAHSILKEYYHGEPWTFENLSESAERLEENGAISRLRPKTEEQLAADEMEERKELVDFILENRQMLPETKRGEKIRFMNPRLTSIETLRQIKSNIEVKRRLATLTPEELKAEVRGPEKSWLHPVSPIYRTHSMLLSLPNTNLQEFRQLVRKCGQTAIDAILAQRGNDNA